VLTPKENTALHRLEAYLDETKPRCLVYQVTAASTSSTIYRTFTVAIDMVVSTALNSSRHDQLNSATASTTPPIALIATTTSGGASHTVRSTNPTRAIAKLPGPSAEVVQTGL
jgi:hypothetical protein